MTQMARSILAALTVTFALATPGIAGEWEYTLSPYVWAAGIDGDVGIGSTTVELDIGFDDIFDNLEWGALGTFEARKDNLFVLVDAIYLELGLVGSAGPARVGVDIDQFFLTGAVGHKIEDTPFSVFAGGRFISIDTTFRGSGPLGVRASRDENLGEPLVGARLEMPLGNKADFVLTADVGGFGVGTDLSWEAAPILNYEFTDSLSGKLGYRILHLDYDESIDLDASMHGWLVGLGLSF